MSEEGAKQGAQMPFGSGPHVCAGMALAQAEVRVHQCHCTTSVAILLIYGIQHIDAEPLCQVDH
jgi:hypothetical protein